MATYTLKSDNIFLRCFDKVAIEVYKLDSPYAFPKTGKSWGNLGIRIGPGNKYKALKIGDKEVNDSELQKLIKELFNSRVIVNREGLCFQATAGVTAAALEVEYYRMFDLFDWAKYQVHASLITRWDRKDFVDGRHLDIVKPNNNLGDGVDGVEYEEKLSKLEIKVRKLEKRVTKLENGEEVECNKNEDLKKKDDEIGKLKEEIEEIKRKKLEDLKIKDDVIEKLKEEIEEVGIKIQEELENNDDEIEKLKEEIEELRRRKQEDLKKKKIYEIEKLKEEIIKEVDLKNQEESKKKDDEIEKLKEKIEEVERKKQEDLQKKDDEIEKLKKTKKTEQDEIDELNRTHKDELKKKQAEFDGLDSELKIFSFLRSEKDTTYDQDTIDKFYKTMVQKCQATVPPSKFVFISTTFVLKEKWANWPPIKGSSPKFYVPLASMQEEVTQIDIEYSDPNIPPVFDRNNWRILRIAHVSESPYADGFTTSKYPIVYYDGNKHQVDGYVHTISSGEVIAKEVIPTPCSKEHMRNFLWYTLAHIQGVGVRVCLNPRLSPV